MTDQLEHTAPRTARRSGPTSQLVGRSLSYLRTNLGITAADLAGRCTALGVPMSQSGISDIERGIRTVSVDQLTGLAAALGVSPLALLVPRRVTADREPVSVAGVGFESGADLLAWLLAERSARGERDLEFSRRSLPAWLWERAND